MVKTLFVVSSIAVGALLLGCEVAQEEPSPTEDIAADEALNGLQSCLAQDRLCQGDAGIPTAACKDGLRTCLEGLVPDAGRARRFDGGVPFAFDAGFPRIVRRPHFDAGRVVPPVFDAGHVVARAVDAGRAAPSVDAARSSAAGCVEEIRTCLEGGGDPLMCLEQGRTCLEAIVAARADARSR